MGVVFSAEDLETHAQVALKVLHANQRPERFLREAGVLAEVAHPAVVRYVAHGVTERGQVYLAMEWLDGRSLSELIVERRLRYPECLNLLRRLLGGLSVAHEHGVVHRDLKPANILLPHDSLGAAKLIDFGIARRRFDPRITERGLLVGTLAYMSPEQARGVSEVAPSSDVFSLGSLVYKCMTGEAPFSGGDATAVLAKVLLDEPTPLMELCAIPRDFDELVGRMLRKTPEHRPRDANAVLDSLERIGMPATEDGTPMPGITTREQRVVWVVLLGGGATPDETDTIVGAPAETPTDGAVGENVVRAGGRYDVLVDGTRVASFVGGGAAGDEALRAARTALDLSEAHPDRPIAIASGLGVLGGRAPFGDAIDRGAALLSRARPGKVRIDEATAR